MNDDPPAQRFSGWLARLRDLVDEPVFEEPARNVRAARPPRTHVDVAKRWLMERRERERLFGPDADLFADPAWDIMLDLFVNRGTKPVSVSSACVAAVVPATTALRWLTTLQDRDLIRRSVHPDDRRTNFISLTEKGLEVMNNVLGDGLARFT